MLQVVVAGRRRVGAELDQIRANLESLNSERSCVLRKWVRTGVSVDSAISPRASSARRAASTAWSACIVSGSDSGTLVIWLSVTVLA